MPQFLFEGRSIEAEDGESVLSALLRNDISLDHGCHAGACQRCLLCAKSGDAPAASTKNLDETLVERGFFLACQAAAGSVAEVSLPVEAAYPTWNATLQDKALLAATVLRVRFEVRDLSAKRGQCLRLVAPSGVSRSYSIAELDHEVVEFHVRLIPGGQMAHCLIEAKVGDPFELQGPFGKCTYRTGVGMPLLFIGSGTGLAPLWGVLKDALASRCQEAISLFHGAATSNDLYFRDELQELADAGHIHYRSCADEVSDLRDLEGSPLTHALAMHPDLTGFRVYLCGHPELVKAAQKRCFLAGANLNDIFADPFEDQSSPDGRDA